MNRPDDDELLRRYREAGALDDARPSPALREAVLAQARAAASSRPTAATSAAHPEGPDLIAPRGHSALGMASKDTEKQASGPAAAPHAANDAFWRLRAVAGVAVIGLATLLFLQFERGTPDERDLTLGSPRITPPPVPVPAPIPAPVPQAQGPAADAPTGAATSDGRAPSPESARPAPVPARTPRPTTLPVPDAGGPLRDPPDAAAAAATRSAAAAKPPGPAVPAPAAEAVAPTPSPAPATPVPAGTPLGAPAVTAAPPAKALAAPPVAQGLEARPRAAPSAASLERGAQADPLATSASAPAPLSAARRLVDAAAIGQLDAARQALADGAPVDATNAAGQTALMLAARRGDEALVRLLLAAGADRARTDPSGRTAAALARQQGHAALAPLLSASESALPTAR